MEIIHGGRGTGKTTKLIQMVKDFGGVLVVPDLDQKKWLIHTNVLAKDQVVTFQEKRNYRGEARCYWIDNLDLFLADALGPGCVGFSIDTSDVSYFECDFSNGR